MTTRLLCQSIWTEEIPFFDAHPIREGQRRVCEAAARPGTVCEFRYVPHSTYATSYAYLAMLNNAALVQGIIDGEAEGFDAAVITCGNDPAPREAREMVDYPVVGITEAGMHLACQMGARFALIVVEEPQVPQAEAAGLRVRSRISSEDVGFGKNVVQRSSTPRRRSAWAWSSSSGSAEWSASFGAVFIKRGVSACDMGTSYHLPRLVGASRSAELLLTGRVFDAAEAERIGLVLDVVDDGTVVERALRTAREIASNGPLAVWMTKETMWQTVDAPSLRHAIDIENRTQSMCTATGEIETAFAAFREGRQPEWKDL